MLENFYLSRCSVTKQTTTKPILKKLYLCRQDSWRELLGKLTFEDSKGNAWIGSVDESG